MGVRIDVAKLKLLRDKASLTQGQLADMAGTSKRTIERLEQGWNGNLSTIKKIAAILNIDAAELLLPTADDEDPSTEWRKPFADYLAAVREVFGYVRFLGLAHRQDERNMPVGKLFVEPELCERYIDPATPLDHWPKRTSLELPRSAGAVGGPRRRGLLETIEHRRRILVLGAPGSGKSTIVSMIACELADERKNPWRQALNDPIPVPIVLRELVLPAKYTFAELIQAMVHTELGRCLARKDLQLVIDAVKEGRGILLFDGIDELSDVGRREALHAALWEELEQKSSRIVMTSRITGHDAVPFNLAPQQRAILRQIEQQHRASFPKLGKPDVKKGPGNLLSVKFALEEHGQHSRTYIFDELVPLFYVVPFDDPRIDRFALNWYRQREESERRAKERAANLAEAVRRDSGTNTLARIPNLLTLMALSHRLDADLPHGKARLYSKIVDTYLDTIDNYRKLTERPDTPLDKKRWLARVAFAMQTRRSKPIEPEIQVGPARKVKAKDDGDEVKREILIQRKDLQELIGIGMEKSGKKSSDEDIQAFIDHIQRRSGLLIERGAGLFAFAHLSFQEFFAAWHMSRLLPGSEDFKEFKNYVNDSAWLETFCFFFEIVADEQQEQKVAFRRELLGTEWESGDAGSLGGASNLILLARLAVDRFSGLDELAEKAIDLCLGWVLQVPASELLSILLAGNQESSSIVGRLVELAREMEDVTLWLGETPIADLSPLSELPKLTGLLLHGTSITDLRPLVGLTALRVLTLDGTTISDLAPLAKLRKLESLSLAEMPVTDLSPLTGLTELRRLYLEGSQVKDLLALADLMKLEMLDLNNTQVADIAPLVGLKKLRRLNLWRTRVSKEQVLSLKRALPDLQIHGPDGGGV